MTAGTFNPATGVFVNSSGSEDAFSGQVIASATWNTINSSYSAALTQLGQGQIITSRVISSPGNITVGTTDSLIYIEANVGTIVLPASSTKLSSVRIYGAASGIFNSNNAIIVPNGVETINGAGTQTLSGAYESILLTPLATGGYVADIAQQGVVTSVGLALPSLFTVTGSPVTTSGTLTGSLVAQLPGLVWASSNSGATAVPTFRAVANVDLTGVSTLAALTTIGTLNSDLTISKASPTEFINASGASQIATLNYGDQGTPKWKLFKFSDNNFFIEDTANSLNALSITAGAASAGKFTIGYTTTSTTTGTGCLVLGGGLGVAGAINAATYNKLTLTAPATAATLTITDAKTVSHTAGTTFAGTDGKTLTISNSLVFSGTDGSTAVFGTGGTVVYSNVATLSSLVSVGTLTTGAINWAGAIATSGALSTSLTTDSSSTTTGALLSAGGLGVAKSIFGLTVNSLNSDTSVDVVAGILQSTEHATGTSTTTLKLFKGSGYGGAVRGYLAQGADSGLILSNVNGGTVTDMMKLSNFNTITAFPSTTIPAGGSLSIGYLMSSTASFGIYCGSSTPTIAAAQGSVYLRSDGSSSSTRMYINSNGSTGWVAVTTAS